MQAEVRGREIVVHLKGDWGRTRVQRLVPLGEDVPRTAVGTEPRREVRRPGPPGLASLVLAGEVVRLCPLAARAQRVIAWPHDEASGVVTLANRTRHDPRPAGDRVQSAPLTEIPRLVVEALDDRGMSPACRGTSEGEHGEEAGDSRSAGH